MEIKTCEEYVLAKLEETENKLQTLTEEHDDLLSLYLEKAAECGKIKGDIERLKKVLEPEIIGETNYIRCNILWPSDEGYQFVKDFFNIEEPVKDEEEGDTIKEE